MTLSSEARAAALHAAGRDFEILSVNHLKDTRSNSKYGSNWFDSNLAHLSMLSCLDYWRGGRNGIIALSLNLSGGDEPSIGSYPVLSANFVPLLMVPPNRFGYNIF